MKIAIDKRIKTIPIAISRIFNILVSPNSDSGNACKLSGTLAVLLVVDVDADEVLVFELVSFAWVELEEVSLYEFVVFKSVSLESTKFDDKFMSIFTAKQFVVNIKETQIKLITNIFKDLFIINSSSLVQKLFTI